MSNDRTCSPNDLYIYYLNKINSKVYEFKPSGYYHNSR